MMSSAPPISVVLPVYNAARYVGDAIDSILRQTWPDFELLVIDDGSTDDSLSVVQAAVSQDVRCRVISRPNKGLVASCNEGIAEARGQFIFRMDADDLSHPERFARQMTYLASNPDCVALGTRVTLADDAMMPIIEMYTSTTHDEIDAENLRGKGAAICHPSVAMRRDALVAAGGYRQEFECAEDLDLFLRLAEVGRMANLPEVLLTYRQHADSVGYAKRALQRERTASAVRAATARRGLTTAQADTKCAPTGSVDERELVAGSEYQTIGDMHRKWGWLSLIGGHPSTARKHAWLALSKEPLRGENVKLMACAIRGR